MLYNSILARSFSKHEQKKFRYGALIGCLLIVLSFCTVLKPYFGPLPVLNLRVSTKHVGLKMLMVKDTSSFNLIFKNNSSRSQHILDDISKSRQAVDHFSRSESSRSQFILDDTSKSRQAVDNSSSSWNSSRSQYFLDDTSNPRQAVDNSSSSPNSSRSQYFLDDTSKSRQAFNNSSSSKNSSRSQHILDDTSKFRQSGDNISSIQNNSRSQYVLDEISEYRQLVDNISTSQIIIATNTSSSKLSIVTKSSQLVANATNNSPKMVKDSVRKIEPTLCSSTKLTDFCQINDNIRIEASSATVFIASYQASGFLADNNPWIIRPYARKTDQTAMSGVREWSVKSVMGQQQLPKCTQNHSVSTILFSTGGYAGNNFHDFTDIVIPLYLTSRQFNGEVQFLVTNKHSFWIEKFKKLLQKLSKYDIIDIDRQTNDVHCFPGGIIGLKRHDSRELNIDSSLSPYSMKDFREFLMVAYSLQKSTAIRMTDGEKKRPRLLIISRKRTRTFTNAEKIAQTARRLGCEVVVAEADMNVSKFAEIVNSCDVLLGVHGAGLTNIVFLPENAVVIQVVPIAIEWLAKADFEEPSKAMNLRYLEYKIKAEESSLIQQYPQDHDVIRNPSSIGKMGWIAFRSLYLDKQNVQLDLHRFRGTLSKALELLHQ